MTMPPGPPPPSSGQPPYGQPPYGQPLYGEQPYGQPAYGRPAHGQPYFPPPPPQPYAGMPQAGPTPPPEKNKFWLILGLVALAVVVIAIAVVLFVVLVLREGTVTATQVKLGDCLSEIPDGSRVRTLKTIDCAEPHAAEVFAVLQMPAGDFPGEDAMVQYANLCAPELASYSPAAVTDDTVRLFVLFPTDETWSDGDRAVTCIATLDPPRAGSLKG